MLCSKRGTFYLLLTVFRSELTEREAKEKAGRTQELMYQYWQKMIRYEALLERVLKGEDVTKEIQAALTP